MPRYAYCISCKMGDEDFIQQIFSRIVPEAVVLHPLFDREEHKNQQWTVKTYPLIPGYLFVYADYPIKNELFYQEKRINRLLQYYEEEGNLATLKDKDLEFANWIYKHEGHIKLSKALLVGDKTKIIDGPLLDYEGEIIKINRQRKSALVRVAVEGKTKDVWLYFHWMTIMNGKLVNWP